MGSGDETNEMMGRLCFLLIFAVSIGISNKPLPYLTSCYLAVPAIGRVLLL